MLTSLRAFMSANRRERGQILVMSVFFFGLVLLVAAVVLDGGFFLRARRDSQNTADAAALAGAQHLPSDALSAEDAALAWASLNGWTNGADGVIVSVTTPYEGSDNKIEVVVEGGAAGVGFFEALLNVNSRAVAEVVITESGSGGPGGPGGPGGGSTPMAPVPGATSDCGGDNAVVDGRVMPGEGYEEFAELVGTAGTNFGQAFFACDSGYFYFALRMNGPDAAAAGGGVANENVYGCKDAKKCPGFSGTYHTDYGTGWEKHDFGALLNSDRARFQLACGDTPVHDFVQDYLREDGSGYASDTGGNGDVIVAGPADSSSAMVFNLENPGTTGWGDPLIQSPPFNPSYPAYDSQYNGWVWEMLYEFRLSRSAYDDCGSGVFFGLPPVDGGTGPVGGMHSSPAKVDEGVFVGISTQTIEIQLVE